MFSNNEVKKLPAVIENSRYHIAEYLKKKEPRQRRLVNLSLLSSFLAIFSLCCAIFAEAAFKAWFTAPLPYDKPMWMLLAYTALFFIVLGVFFILLLKGHNDSSRISSARSCDAKLQSLSSFIKNKQLTLEEALTLYTSHIGEIPFIRVS